MLYRDDSCGGESSRLHIRKKQLDLYYWDNAGHWSVSRELAELWKNEGTKRLLEVVFDSVLTLDYNYLIILPAIVCVRLLGSSRYIFLSSIANFGYLPVCVLVWYMAKRYTKHQLIITTITLLFFFQRLVSTKLLADYSSLYVAYKIGLDKDILLLFRYFGIIPLILFFAAGICLLFSKSQRCDAAFLMIWSVLCFCLFVRVQTHGQQHLLMYAPAFMCMIRYLDSLGAKGLHVGLLASSFTLNQDMLLNSEASLSLPRVSDTPRSYLVYLPDVDQRDGWSDALFKCDILAVADPPQTHLGEKPSCDGQDDIDAMDDMVREYLSGSDIVYGVRSSRESDSFFKRTTARGFYRFMRLLGAEVVYDHADYRLLSKRVLDELAGYCEVNIFLRGMIPLIGFRSSCVAYERKKRAAGKSHYPLVKMLSLALDGITSLSTKPLRLITGLGIAVALLSFAGIIWSFVRYFSGRTVTGWASMTCIICFLCGVQLLCLGIIGEYVGKLYLEVKSRPRYIIAERTGSVNEKKYRQRKVPLSVIFIDDLMQRSRNERRSIMEIIL